MIFMSTAELNKMYTCQNSFYSANICSLLSMWSALRFMLTFVYFFYISFKKINIIIIIFEWIIYLNN